MGFLVVALWVLVGTSFIGVLAQYLVADGQEMTVTQTHARKTFQSILGVIRMVILALAALMLARADFS